jgi:hypothetical protein
MYRNRLCSLSNVKKSPIKLTACDHAPVCHGYHWQITDEETLAKLVAWVAVGRYHRAHEILTTVKRLPKPTPTDGARKQAIERLTVAGSVTREHRDGWVFQIISWIAACTQAGRKIRTSIPHTQLAGKGFDGIHVPLTEKGKSFELITICEDKATEYPRNTVSQKVWPEFEDVEEGRRDSELTAELTAILERAAVPDIERLLESVQWQENRHYRVSVTVTKSEDADWGGLFKGYQDAVDGSEVKKRRAETLCLPDLRKWMDAFCIKVIKIVRAL